MATKISSAATSAQTRSIIRKNLRGWFNEATKEEMLSGLLWYAEAQRFSDYLSTTYNVSGEVAAGVISALSPNNKWPRNKVDAEAVLAAHTQGHDSESVRVCTYNANKRKAFAIASGDAAILKQSPKTYAFARNVGEQDGNYVTIDKWHLRACQTLAKEPKALQTSVTAKQYKVLQDETLKVAKEFGVTGYEFQAVVWVTIRNRWSS